MTIDNRIYYSCAHRAQRSVTTCSFAIVVNARRWRYESLVQDIKITAGHH